ncbi:DUF6779 domain-containing protein [Rhodococcus rhodochrous]|uniref:DUF6779 domain-containing protein n=1 Tax=Rhodococcus rhodochrous TaxID=1829 RepID=UPI000AE4163D|nr:DUF6779 domain-containing protein [Rhodococcus rhodochrous]
MAGLLALALIASLFLVFSDSVQLLRVGLVVALWAATVGAIAMTKYRRESALDRAKVRDLQTVYELQLEREIAARREYELTVEEKVRSELHIDADQMAALRAELGALRRNLEVLFDGRLPEDRAALWAGRGQLQELGGGNFRVTAAPRPAGPFFASPDDEPVTAETTVVTDGDTTTAVPRRPAGATAASGASPAPQRQDRTEVEVEAKVEAAVEDRTGAEAPPEQPEDAGSRAEQPENGSEQPRDAGAQPEDETSDADDDAEPTGRRARRRRSDDAGEGAHSQGRTVAEILAALSAER